MISQKCWPSPSSLVPRMAAVPQLYSVWKSTLRLSQLSRVAEDLFRSSQTQSKSARARDRAGRSLEPRPGGHQPSPGAHCSRSSSSPQRQSLPRRTACRPPQKGASLWLSQSQKDSPVTGTALGTGGGAVASGSESESLCWEERVGCAHPPSPPPALCPPVAHTVSMP